MKPKLMNAILLRARQYSQWHLPATYGIYVNAVADEDSFDHYYVYANVFSALWTLSIRSANTHTRTTA